MLVLCGERGERVHGGHVPELGGVRGAHVLQVWYVADIKDMLGMVTV